MSDLTDLFGPVIHSYTRKQAIADGFLVDGGDEVQKLAREAGFLWHVAFTVEAWADAVAWDEAHGAHQDVTGRLWDVFMVLRYAIKAAPGDHLIRELPFSVLRVPNKPGATRATYCRLVSHSGPGDEGEPVLTIMLPGQD